MKKITVIILALFILVGVGFYFLQKSSSPLQTKEESIKQAQVFLPEGGCTDALVPAVHKATGARFTFPSGCLAPGWESENQ